MRARGSPISVSSPTTADEHTVIKLTGEVDLGNAPQIGRELRSALSGEPATLVVDLSEMTFMDSTLLGLLVQTRQRAIARGSRVLLVRPQQTIRRVFQLTGLDKRFEWLESADSLTAEMHVPGHGR